MPAHFMSVLIVLFIWQQEKTPFSVKIRSVQFLNNDKIKGLRDMNAGFRQHIQNLPFQVERRSVQGGSDCLLFEGGRKN
jgi:hypothetical protein